MKMLKGIFPNVWGSFWGVYSSILLQSCHLLCWKWKQTYLRNKTDVIAQSGGWDLLTTSIFHVFQIHFFTGNVDFNTFVKNWTSIGVSSQTAWGKMLVLTVGSFQVFIKWVTLTRFASQSPCFPENLDSHFLCLNNWFLFRGQICEACICLEYRI